MLRQYELVDLVKSYDPDADEDALNRAYVFAMKKHGAPLRSCSHNRLRCYRKVPAVIIR